MSERFARRGAHRHVQAARRSTHHSWMALAILGIGLTTQAQAQEPVGIPVSMVPAGTISRKAPYRLILDPIAGTIELQNQGGKLLDRWAQFAPSSPLAEIPADGGRVRPPEGMVTYGELYSASHQTRSFAR